MVVSALAMLFAHLCGCSPVLEQPTSSVLPKLEPLKNVLEFIGSKKVVVWHGAYGGESHKPLQLWSPRDLSSLVKPKPKNLVSDLVEYGFKVCSNGDKKKSYSGTQALKSSQTYCKSFGKAVALLAKSWLSSE